MDTAASPQVRLTGWKEIAAFLKKGIRTVQRWERDLGLPIRRIRTSSRGQAVFAEPHEIEAWLTKQFVAVLAENKGSPGSRGR